MYVVKHLTVLLQRLVAASPVPMHVSEERWEERNSSESCSAVTKPSHEQRLVGLEVDHTQLLIKKL